MKRVSEFVVPALLVSIVWAAVFFGPPRQLANAGKVGATQAATVTLESNLQAASTPCTGVSVTVLPPSTAMAGTPVTITASASGCPNPLYQFWMLAPDYCFHNQCNSVWFDGQAYSATKTFNWDTTMAVGGTWHFSVWARDASSSGISGDSLGKWDAYSAFTYGLKPTPCTSVTVTSSPPNTALAGTPVTITGTAAGCPHPLFNFWMLAPGAKTWVGCAQCYNPGTGLSGNFGFDTTGLAAGIYTFSVWARDQSSMAVGGGTSGDSLGRWDAYKAIQYSVTSTPCTSVSVTTSPPSPASPGTRVTITGSASVCPNPLYKFWMLAPGSSTWQLVQNYSFGSAAFSWDTTGRAAGTYRFSVWARDNSSTGKYSNSLGTWDANSAITYTLT